VGDGSTRIFDVKENHAGTSSPHVIPAQAGNQFIRRYKADTCNSQNHVMDGGK